MLYRLLALLALPAVTSAEVTLDASRSSGSLEAPFQLVIEASQSRPVPTPDFSAIERNFEILNQRKSSRSSFRGGKSLYISRWELSLKPLEAGVLKIPPLVVGYERSPLFQYRVEAAANRPAPKAPNAPPVALSATLEEPEAFSREAVHLRVKLFYATPLSQAELTEPEGEGLRIYGLGSSTHGQEVMQGRRYRTIEQRYSVFAEAPGEYQIAPIEFEGQGPQADDEGYQAASEPVSFFALPPEEEAVTPWLVADQLRLDARWEDNDSPPRAGDTRTRTLILEAQGIPADWLPLPTLEPPAGVRFYPQEPRRFQDTEGDRLVSRLEVDYRLLFVEPGLITLPAWHIDWWDGEESRPQRAELEPLTLQVAPFMEAEASPNRTSGAEAEPPSTETPPSASWTGWLWALIALVCAAGWTLTRNRLKQAEQRLQEATSRLEQQQSAAQKQDYQEEEARAYHALAQACRQNDPALAARALIFWAKYAWPSQAIGDFEDLDLCAQDPTLSYLLRNLEHSLEGRDDDPWMGDLLLSQVDRLRRRRQRHAA